MRELVQRIGSYETQLKQELTRQLGDTDLATELTRISVGEISAIHQTATTKVAATLKEAKQIIMTATQAGKMTPGKEYLLRAQTEAYLLRMLAISSFGSSQITQLLLTCSMRR